MDIEIKVWIIRKNVIKGNELRQKVGFPEDAKYNLNSENRK